MVGPLWILAVGAVLSGLAGIPRVLTFGFLPENRFGQLPRSRHREGGAGGGASCFGCPRVGSDRCRDRGGGDRLVRGEGHYAGDRGLAKAQARAARFPAIHRVLANKYYVDELYDATVVRGFWATARGLFRFDASIIDGLLVNGARNVTVAFSLLSGPVRQIRGGRPGQPGGIHPRRRLPGVPPGADRLGGELRPGPGPRHVRPGLHLHGLAGLIAGCGRFWGNHVRQHSYPEHHLLRALARALILLFVSKDGRVHPVLRDRRGAARFSSVGAALVRVRARWRSLPVPREPPLDRIDRRAV